MTNEEKQVYDWALHQNYQSVAAKNAKTLAELLTKILSVKSGEPLTPEQLREMDGQPVWVQTPGIHQYGRWVIVDGVDIEEKTLYCQGDYTCRDYGKTWLAYAYPPAHIDREAWGKCGYCGRAKIKMVRMDLEYNDSHGSPERLNPNRYPKFCPICGKPLNETAWAELEKRMGVFGVETSHENGHK